MITPCVERERVGTGRLWETSRERDPPGGRAAPSNLAP
jgi:hypothetical protein